MRDRLRIGIVGAGEVIRRYHIPAINGVPEVVHTMVVDVDAERARRAAERYCFPKSASSLDELADNVDIAIVAVPNWQHAPVACELLARGIHVLCEKPMARNVEECQAMIEASRRGRALLAIGHNRRFRQHVELARRLLSKGLIGQVLTVDAEEGSRKDWARSAAYFDREQSGGGALLDVGIHTVDLIRWLVGDFEQVEYQGNETTETVESDCELRFRLATGATGRLVVSRTRDMRQLFTLTGSEGYLEIGLWGPNLRIRAAKGKAFQNFEWLDVAVARRVPNDASFVSQLRNLVLAVRGEESLLVNGQEGLAAVEVAHAAYRGMRSLPIVGAAAGEHCIAQSGG